MSDLWTPTDGNDAEPAHGAGRDGPTAEELAALREAQERLAATPVIDLIAHHALGLWQLALLHLGLLAPVAGPEAPEGTGTPGTGTPGTGTPGTGRAPDLASAGLAIDALAALVDGLGTRLGPHEQTLRDALTQAQQAYVAVADTRPDRS